VAIGDVGCLERKARRQDFDSVRVPLDQRGDRSAMLGSMGADPEKYFGIVKEVRPIVAKGDADLLPIDGGHRLVELCR